MEEIQTNKNRAKNDKVCKNCEWFIQPYNNESSYCLLTLRTVNSFDNCNNYKNSTGIHITY